MPRADLYAGGWRPDGKKLAITATGQRRGDLLSQVRGGVDDV